MIHPMLSGPSMRFVTRGESDKSIQDDHQRASLKASAASRAAMSGMTMRFAKPPRPSRKQQLFAKELSKMMLSAKNTELLAENLRHLPPQRTPPELDRLQDATRALPIFRTLRQNKEKWRSLCRAVRHQVIGDNQEVYVTESQMFVVVLSGRLLVHTVDTEPFGAGPYDKNTSRRAESADQTSMIGGMSSADWEDVFNDTDADGSGALSPEEIFSLLSSCGVDVEFEEVVTLVLELDADGSQEMEFDEFLNLTRRLVDDSGGRKWNEQPGSGFFKVYKPGSYFGERSMMNTDRKITGVFSSETGNEPVSLMILDMATYNAIMQGTFDSYVEERVQFMRSNCSIFRVLHPLSNIECISFLADVEDAGDDEFIIKQGGVASEIVVLIEGCGKLVRKMEQKALEAAAMEVGWKPDSKIAAGVKPSQSQGKRTNKDRITNARMKSARHVQRRGKHIEMSHIYQTDMCGEASLLGDPVYTESVVCVRSCKLLRFPLAGLEQFLDESDMLRLVEFSRMRISYRDQQLKYNAATLLSSSKHSAKYVQTTQWQRTAKRLAEEARWLPIPETPIEQSSSQPEHMSESDDRFHVMYTTPAAIRRQAQEEIEERRKTYSVKLMEARESLLPISFLTELPAVGEDDEKPLNDSSEKTVHQEPRAPNMAPPDRPHPTNTSVPFSVSSVTLPAIDERLVSSMLDQQLANVSWSAPMGNSVSIGIRLPSDLASDDDSTQTQLLTVPTPEVSTNNMQRHIGPAPPPPPAHHGARGTKSACRSKPIIDMSTCTPLPLIPDGFMAVPGHTITKTVLPPIGNDHAQVVDSISKEDQPGKDVPETLGGGAQSPLDGIKSPGACAANMPVQECDEVEESDRRAQVLLGDLAEKTSSDKRQRRRSSQDSAKHCEESGQSFNVHGYVVVPRQVGGHQGRAGRLLTGRRGRIRNRLQDVPQFRQTEQLERQLLHQKHQAQRNANILGTNAANVARSASTYAIW